MKENNYKKAAKEYLIRNPAYDYWLFAYEVMDCINDFNNFCADNPNIKDHSVELSYATPGLNAEINVIYSNGEYDGISINAAAADFAVNKLQKRAELEELRDCLENIFPAFASTICCRCKQKDSN